MFDWGSFWKKQKKQTKNNQTTTKYLREGVVQARAAARDAAFSGPLAAVVVRVRRDAQEADLGVHLADAVLQRRARQRPLVPFLLLVFLFVLFFGGLVGFFGCVSRAHL